MGQGPGWRATKTAAAPSGEKKGLRPASAPGRLRGVQARPECAQSVGRREGGVGCRERAAGQAGGSPGAPGRAGAKPPGRRAGARETHGVEQVERAEAVLGTREASANHLGACGSRQLQVHGAPRSRTSLFVCALGAWPSRESRADTGGRTRRWGSCARRAQGGCDPLGNLRPQQLEPEPRPAPPPRPAR